MAIMELGEHLDALFQCQLLKNSSGDGSLGDSLTINKFGTDMLGLLSPKTSLIFARAL
jgi:hypothetical protein